ncbi:SAV_2336 N-terminal domain-related protein [Floridanema aerugineum]|uniref:SAV_2336 N-terminal domain-related protein n=1 Tax=Floridaenema aerugineum BLCC-F46 TaxID=3153654 RepID=A0ABV4X9W4_9CYAN
MSKNSSTSIGEFSGWLKQAKLDIDAIDIADILWLAVQLSKVSPASTSTPESTEVTPQNDRYPPIQTISSIIPYTNLSTYQPTVSAYTSWPEKSSEDADYFPVRSFRAPTAEALPNKLELARSLRPLRRKVLSQTDKIIDEEATAIEIAQAIQITQENVWAPVLKPAPERWLELAIVIEKNDSFPIWQQTIREFQQLIEQHGTFRNVRSWHLQADNTGKLQLFAGERTTSEQRPRSFKELLDPSGRRLILVVSDCVSSTWRSHPQKQTNHIKSILDLWAKNSPLTLLQLLPQHLWSRSALGAGIFVNMRSQAPAIPNSQLETGEIPSWLEIDRQTQLTLPIVTLEPKPLKQWAKVIAGSGQTQTVGVILDDPLLEIQAEMAAETLQTSVTAQTRVKHFWATASLTARRLAGLMAAAPVSLPVVYMIQRQMLPESSPVHLAEVFMSGLLRAVESNNATNKTYDFVEGVRECLIDATPISETETVLEQLTEFVAEKTGLALHDFTAFLAADSAWDESIRGEIIPFARITREVLQRLGGEYAQLVESASQKQVISEPVSPAEVTNWLAEFPPLQKFNFEVATITFIDDSIDPQTFDFEVVFIEFNQAATLSNNILEIVDEAVVNEIAEHLIDIEQQVLNGALENLTYEQIYNLVTESANYSESQENLKDRVSEELWQILKEIVGEKVNKSDAKNIINQWATRSRLTIRSYPQKATGFIERLSKDIQIEMMLIPGGSFIMGSPPEELKRQDDESPQHKVTLQPFFMAKYTVTQAQWQFVAQLPQVNRELDPDPSHFKGTNRPVERISWLDAVEFCDRLSQHTKKPYRLPSEAEWEYACRAGTTTPFHFGETITTDFANYNGNYTYGAGSKGVTRGETTPVGSFGVANAFGLYDMHGNVWEWCADRWHPNYQGAPNDGSAWINERNQNEFDFQIYRLLRGGSWNYFPENCRSAVRYCKLPGNNFDYLGFRVVCAAAWT